MDEQVLSIAMVYGPRVLVAIIMLAAGHFAGQWAGRARAIWAGRLAPRMSAGRWRRSSRQPKQNPPG